MNATAEPATGPSEGELFKRILGADWSKLHHDIQMRFAKNPGPNKPLLFRGTMSELRCSLAGKILAYITKPMINGALIPFSDTNFPVDIQVYAKSDCRAIFKHRIYRLHGRKPIQFASRMQESEKGEVLEYVGMGLGMKLILHVHGGDLYFTSDGYFWEIRGRRIPIPGIFTPGKTFLCHRNDSPGQFSIRIEIKHCLFGTTFLQVGVFHEIAEHAIAEHESPVVAPPIAEAVLAA
jgi:hypothetical protein